MKKTMMLGALAVLVPAVCAAGGTPPVTPEVVQIDGRNGRTVASEDKRGPVVAQGSQSGQQQPVPNHTREQIEELKKQNERARSQNALIQQATEAMAAKNWQAAVAPLKQLIA